jgi:hypothetical protein
VVEIDDAELDLASERRLERTAPFGIIKLRPRFGPASWSAFGRRGMARQSKSRQSSGAVSRIQPPGAYDCGDFVGLE